MGGPGVPFGPGDQALPPPGWYADPSGARDCLRYWDGAAWTPLVRDLRPRRRWPWIAGGAVAALALIGAIALPTLSDPGVQTRPAPPVTSPRLVPPTAAPPSGQPTVPGISAACQSGDPDHRQAYPHVAGEVLGGGFRYRLLPGWRASDPPPLEFGNDVAGGRPANQGSPAWFAVGAVRADQNEFAAPPLAARTIADCLDGSDAVDGHTLLDAKDVPGTAVPGARETGTVLAHYGPADGTVERTVVIVVSDTGSPESMPFLVAAGAHQGEASDSDLLSHRERLSASP
ncbi:DUF2510 domain-containing protein [Mariniluteicoccus endophyticus]